MSRLVDQVAHASHAGLPGEAVCARPAV